MTASQSKTGASSFDHLFNDRLTENGRVKTGITELDEMLRGGFMEGDTVLVAGGAGSGKTTLALQYLVNGITKFNDPGVYITFEQLPDQIYRDAKSFGWDLRQMEQQDTFRLICTSPNLLLESDSENLLDEILREVRPRRLVVDSLSHLDMYVEKSAMRKETYQLTRLFKTRGISSLMIWESPIMTGSYNVTQLGLSFLTDCIVALRPVEIESSLHKALVILKMRGSDHDKQLREFRITSHGIEIGSSFNEFEALMTGAPRRVSVMQDAVSSFSHAFSGRERKQKP